MDAKIIGSKITDARKEAGMSQAQLAQQLFISPQAVGKWERGESVPDIITINRLADILNVNLNYFSDNADTAITPNAQENSIAQEKVESEPTGVKSFNGKNLQGSDFQGIVAHKSKFNASALQGADFSGANLTGSSFTSCNLSNAKFSGTNLTDCIITTCDLTGASFEKTIMVRTEIRASENMRAKFNKARLAAVQFTKIDLRQAIFEECSFDDACFKNADLSGVCLDRQVFNRVSFDHTLLENTSFKGATLKNVSFKSAYAITNKYYRAIKTINFEGAKIDKMTIATLKGYGANLSNVTAIS